MVESGVKFKPTSLKLPPSRFVLWGTRRRPSCPRPLPQVGPLPGRCEGGRNPKTCVFAETNPPFFVRFSCGSACEYIGCIGKLREKSVVRFWKTNPPGDVFWWGSVAATTTLQHLPPKYNVWRVVRLRSVRLVWKTNPPERAFGALFIEKWLRLPRKYGVRRLVGLGLRERSHAEGRRFTRL